MSDGERSKPRRVWVLYGGDSAEREVSLRSGQGIFRALKQKGYDVEAFDVSPGESMRALDWKRPPDLVYVGLHGGFGEDGGVQGFLESLKIPYVGSGVGSSSICFHKGLAKKLVTARGVPCPHSYDLVGGDAVDEFVAKSGADVFAKKWFIKAARQGSTIGIERFDPSHIKGDPKTAFAEACRRALAFDDYLLVEEWIEGPELTAAVLLGRALPLVEIRPLSQFYDYASKYTVGKTEYLCPAPIPGEVTREVQRLAVLAFEALECRDYARADFMLSSRGPLFLEMNTVPGMTETSLVPKAAAAGGLDYAGFVDFVVQESFRRQRSSST